MVRILLLFLTVSLQGQVIRTHGFYTGDGSIDYIDYISWYKFTGDYTDESTNWDGTNNGASISGNQLYFPGTDGADYVSTPINMLPSGIDTFTISFQLNVVPTANENHYILGNAVHNTGDDGIYFYANNAGNGYYDLVMVAQKADDSRDWAITTTGGECVTNSANNVMHHWVVIVYYYLANVTNFIYYRDGVYCCTAGADSSAAKSIVMDGTGMNIGNDLDLTSGGLRDGSRVDNVMVFDGDLRITNFAWFTALLADPTTMPVQ